MDNLRFSSAPTADSIDASIAQRYPDCEPVAVIGYACHFPEAPDGETFWRNLLEGRECSRRFTREALLAAGLDTAIIDDPCYVNIGTVLDNADCFDATLFEHLQAAMPAGCRLVVNGVTLETQALLVQLHASHGGQLQRLELSSVEALGRMRSWKAARPLVQWVWQR